MEQVFNPLLGQMSVDDLNQRYADSFVMYGGQPRYVVAFRHDGDGNIQIEHQEPGNGMNRPKSVFDRFEWDQLNVARPASGWFVYPGDNPSYFYLTYPNKRQYKRGLSGRNTNVHVPFYMAPTSSCYFKAALEDASPIEVINDDVLKNERSVIPRRDRLFLRKGPNWNFYVRNEHVITVADQKVLLHMPKFLQELREVNHSGLLRSFEVIETPRPKKQKGDWDGLVRARGEIDQVIEEMDFEAPREPRIRAVEELPHFSILENRDWAELGQHLIANYTSAHLTRHELNRNVNNPPQLQTYYNTDIGTANVAIGDQGGQGKIRLYVLSHEYYKEVVKDAADRMGGRGRGDGSCWYIFVGHALSPLHRGKVYKACIIGYSWGDGEYEVSMIFTQEDL